MKGFFVVCIAALSLLVAGSALAGNSPSKAVYNSAPSKDQQVLGSTTKPRTKPTSKPVATTRVKTGTLPFTGLDLGVFVGAGIVLVLAGASLRRVSRKQL